jgi:thiamine kinase-like enzyme
MTLINFEYLNKNKHSTSLTEKYKIIDCQKIINKNPNITNWIELNKVIKETKDLKIFNGILTKTHNIVIKIGKSETIIKEYKIIHQLISISGFIQYYCFFTCTNNIKQIINNSSICALDGDKINILLMKHYKTGSIKDYNWDYENFNLLKSLLKQIFYSLYLAYIKYGFLHNDTHFGNFLLKPSNELYAKYEKIGIRLYGFVIVIMDFENSLFDNDIGSNSYFLSKSFYQIINNILFELNIIISNKKILDYLNDLINTNKIVNIQYLLSLIDEIEMKEKKDINKLIKYEPNVF